MRSFRLPTRFLLYFTVLTAAIMALVFLLVDKGVGDRLLAQAERRSLALGRHLASLAGPSFDAGDRAALARIEAAARPSSTSRSSRRPPLRRASAG